MTPVREALEQVHAFMKADIDNGDSDLWTPEYRALWDTVNEALSAAPGEPRAVKPLEWNKHPDDNEWYSIDEGHYQISDYVVHHSPNSDGWCLRVRGNLLDEDYPTQEAAKAAAQADYEQRIRSALVTTPQPAAGWNGDDIEAAISAYNEIWEKSDGIDASNVADHRRNAMRAALIALRREAPAPAEGATIPDSSNMDARFEWLQAKAIDMGYMLVPEPEHPDSPHARPDTAEARLREALVDLHEAILALSKFGKNNVTLFEDSPLENQECFDAWLRLNTAQTKAAEVLGPPFKLRFSSGWLASKIKSDPDIETDIGKALSPPSGGDGE